MKFSVGRASLGVLLVVATSSIIAAVPAQAAWSPAATAFEQTVTTPPAVGVPTTTAVSARQAVLDDGSSVVAWLQSTGGGPEELHARVVNRGGTAVGPDIPIRTAPGSVDIQSWVVTALGDGVVILWVESSVLAGVQIEDLQYRTLSSAGVLGATQQLDFDSVPTVNGRVGITGLSASSGGGFANVSWNLSDRRGVPTSDCDAYIFSSTTGPCTLINKVRFARFAQNGTLATPVTDLLSREFTSENTTCPFTQPTFTSLLTAPLDGSATALIRDYCRINGGQADPTLLLSRVPKGGQPTAARVIQQLPEFGFFGTPFLYWSAGISAEGTAVFSLDDKVFRVTKGGKVSGPVDAVGSLAKGWSPTEDALELIALPGDRVVALFTARATSGGNLTRAVWSRMIEADGSLGKPKQLYSKTWSASGSGYQFGSYIDVDAANGLGKATGTVVLELTERNTVSSTSTNSRLSLIGIELNGSGARVGSPTVFDSASTDYSPTTDYSFTDLMGSVEVSRDGTASVLSELDQTKYLSAAPNTGFSRVAVANYKLVRNANTCGVTPSLCKANLKVNALKLAPAGGRKAKLTITLRNAGSKDASKVKARLSATGGAKVPKTVSFAKVLEGKNAKKTVTVTLGPGSGSIVVKVGKSSKTTRY